MNGLHPVLDAGTCSLRVLCRLDPPGGRPLALVELTTWSVVEVPADVAADAQPGSLWFGEPVSPAAAGDPSAAARSATNPSQPGAVCGSVTVHREDYTP